MESIGKREKTLFFLFLKQVIGIVAAVVVELAIFIIMFSIGLNMGIILPADYTENYLFRIENQIADTTPFPKELIPETCEYGLFDFSGKYITGNVENTDKLEKVLKGKEHHNGYKVIKREDGYCIIHYSVEAHFSSPVLHDMFPHLEVTTIGLFLVLVVVTLGVNAWGFGKKLRRKLRPLLEEIEHIKDKELIATSTKSDIREFNEVLFALNEMKEALGASLKREWEAEQRRKDNISALAHDIKTPVTIIKGNVELLQEEKDIEQIYRYAAVINANTDRIEHYIGLLINETKNIEDNNIMSLQELLANIKTQSKMLCETEQIPIVINEDTLDHSKRKIKDSEQILRAVMNMVTNAIDYTDSEKGIALSLYKENKRIHLKVEDYGPGFSNEALCHATEQFYTEKKERSGMHYGLGLYFAKSVAKEQNGELCIENKEDGTGAEVTFILPCG